MKRIIKANKLISLLLVVILCIGLMPVNVYSDEADPEIETQTYTDIGEQVELLPSDGASAPETVYEIASRREENVKHYLMPDGNVHAVVFPEPVHAKDQIGVWRTIDSSLSLENGIYSTPDGRVKLAERADADQPLATLTSGGYTIKMYFAPQNSNDNHISANAEARLCAPLATGDDEVMSWSSIDAAIDAARQTSSVLFENADLNTDIEYTVSSGALKENIIINARASSYVYMFKLELSGLNAELRPEGNIVLRDSTTSEARFDIPAPFMMDADGNISRDVEYALVQAKPGIYLLSVTADADWINTPTRALPVKVDPTISSTTGYESAYVSEEWPDDIMSIHDMYVSAFDTSFIKAPLPTFPSGATVVGGTLSVGYYFTTESTDSITVGAYQMLEAWSPGDLYYNMLSSNDISSICLSSITVTSWSGAPASRVMEFDLGSLPAAWQNGTANNGVAIKFISGALDDYEYEHSTIYIPKYSSSSTYYPDPCFTFVYTEPAILDGVYKIKNKANDLYLDVRDSGYTENTIIQQATGTTSTDRDQLFKITYVGMYGNAYQYNYYTIRAMTNSIMALGSAYYAEDEEDKYVHIDEISFTDIWSNLLFDNLWAISSCNNGAYTIKNGHFSDASYLTSPGNATINAAVKTGTDGGGTNDSQWMLERYTGDPIENIQFSASADNLIVGETFVYQAHMYSSVKGKNGPVNFSVTNAMGNATNIATIDTYYGDISTSYIGYCIVKSYYSNLVCVQGLNIQKPITGTFSLQNKNTRSFMQINNGLDTTFFELHEPDGGSDQSFTIINANNGYYKIKSGDQYLQAPNETDEKVVRAVENNTDSQLWKIDLHEGVFFKISSKSIPNGYVAAGDTLGGNNGLNIWLRQSCDDGKDQWAITVLPISTGELRYNPDIWNIDGIIESSNCYGYAINLHPAYFTREPDMWDRKDPGFLDTVYNNHMALGVYRLCVNANFIKEGAMLDASNSVGYSGFTFSPINKYQVCSYGSYKVALVICEGDDYHWYRQNPDGSWSHKQGQTEAKNYDDSNNIIYDPEICNRGKYNVFGGFFQVTPWGNETETHSLEFSLGEFYFIDSNGVPANIYYIPAPSTSNTLSFTTTDRRKYKVTI